MQVEDWGDLALPDLRDVTCANPAVHSLRETVAWAEIADRTGSTMRCRRTVADHHGRRSFAGLGSVAGAAALAAR
jgi:arginase